MNFYDNILSDITSFYNSDTYTELKEAKISVNIIVQCFKTDYKYPREICILIIEDRKLFLKIIDRFRKIIIETVENDFSFKKTMKIINKLLITELDTLKKQMYNKFETIIKDYLEINDWFSNFYNDIKLDNSKFKNIKPNETLVNFNWRPNQREAIDLLYNNGLQTGIHCQATGTGKSYIIIHYIDYVKRILNAKCKIILFTERVNILKDLFDFKDNKINTQKLEEWKNDGIGDLTQFNIIDRVTIKQKDWVKLLNKTTEPTLLVINRAYLTLNSDYKNINNIDLIIHDECHSSTSTLCHTFLLHFKNKKVPIVGFSATPLRSGKTDGEFNKDKLLEIFSDNNKLKLLTDYNMIYSIEQKLILPPKFFWYNMQTYQSKNDDLKSLNLEISESEIGSVLNILNDLVCTLPNKKIVAWCGTINLCNKWHKQFENFKSLFSDINKMESFVDTSENNNKDYEKFKEEESFCILFCAQKHREGSDIKNLDTCIFLDKVKNRGSIPFIQSIGRVLRLNKDNSNKICGVIIDGVVKDNEQYDKIFIDKILGYYFALSNLTLEDDDKYEQYIKLRDVVKFDKENKIINITVQNTIIPINCKKLNWDNVISKFQILLEKKMNLSPEEVFNIYINKIKTLEPFKNPENDFWKEYEKLDHELLDLPKDIYTPYENIWKTKTWYDLLDFKNIYINLKKFRKEYAKINPTIKIITKSIYKKIKGKLNAPPYPLEYYRLDNINNYSDLLQND